MIDPFFFGRGHTRFATVGDRRNDPDRGRLVLLIEIDGSRLVQQTGGEIAGYDLPVKDGLGRGGHSASLRTPRNEMSHAPCDPGP